LLTLLDRDQPATSPLGSSSGSGAIVSDDSDVDDALESIDDVFTELALL
jgi:hypothetical protein